MVFQKGNNLWELCENPGRPPKYNSPKKLWDACVEYFKWVEANPLRVQKHAIFKGNAVPYWEETPRAMLLCQLCRAIGIGERTWREWRKERDDLLPVITRVESVIWEQKFQGAAAELFNSNIIAQELGLKSRLEHSISDETLEEFLEGLEPDVPEG